MKSIKRSLPLSLFLIMLSTTSVYAEAPMICELEELALNGFNFLMAALPFIALFSLGYGAWLWMTSMGDPQKLQQARDTLAYSVIGLVVALSAVLVVLTIESFLLSTDFQWSKGASAIVRVSICEDSAVGTNPGDPCPCEQPLQCVGGVCQP